MLRLLSVLLAGAFLVSVASSQDEVEVRAYGVMPNGERKANITIVREEVERTTLLPLLPYIFFDEGSSEIPSRYVLFSVRESRVFSETEFVAIERTGRRSSIAAYYNLLNIVGKRLNDHPEARVTLTGSTDGDESKTVAGLRADAVKDYLTSVFGISETRVKIETTVLPTSATTTANREASAQENRRVSISGPWKIVKPVIVRDTTTTVSPPAVEFEVKSSFDSITRLTIRAWQLDYEEPLYLYEHIRIPKTPRVWRLDRDPASQPTSEDDLEYEAEVADNIYRSYTSKSLLIPVRQVTLRKKKSGLVRGSTEIHQYNLILFDFASGKLRGDHKRIIDTMIAQDGYVLPFSTVLVHGYSDSTGSDEINLRLSTERAEAAAARMRERNKNVLPAGSVLAEGFGKSDVMKLPDGEALPESRMYSRTVHIIVQNRRER